MNGRWTRNIDDVLYVFGSWFVIFGNADCGTVAAINTN